MIYDSASAHFSLVEMLLSSLLTTQPRFLGPPPLPYLQPLRPLSSTLESLRALEDRVQLHGRLPLQSKVLGPVYPSEDLSVAQSNLRTPVSIRLTLCRVLQAVLTAFFLCLPFES